jgi:hypothetical protein
MSRDNQTFNMFFEIYEKCIQHDPERRPTAEDILRQLKS